MLSNTAETKPSPSAVDHDAIGKRSTGIIDAASTRLSRKVEPLSVAGSTDQSGRRHAAVATIAIQTAAPRNGKRSAYSGNCTLVRTFTAMAASRIVATMPTRPQSTLMRLLLCFTIGEYECCCSAAGMPQTTSATPAAT